MMLLKILIHLKHLNLLDIIYKIMLKSVWKLDMKLNKKMKKFKHFKNTVF